MIFIREVTKIIDLTYAFVSPSQFTLGVKVQKGLEDQVVLVRVPLVQSTYVGKKSNLNRVDESDDASLDACVLASLDAIGWERYRDEKFGLMKRSWT